MVSPIEYKDFVRSLMTDFDHDHNLLHFTSGIITEFTEYLEVMDGDEPAYSEEAILELGDVLFYCYAAAIELLELRDRYFEDKEECTDEKIHMGFTNDGGEAEFDHFQRCLASGAFTHTGASHTLLSEAWLFARPLEKIQKWAYHGQVLYLIELKNRLTECLNLVFGLCQRENYSLQECMALNMAKLQKRHPDGFRGVSWKNDGPAGG